MDNSMSYDDHTNDYAEQPLSGREKNKNKMIDKIVTLINDEDIDYVPDKWSDSGWKYVNKRALQY